MKKILALREQRAKLWEDAKNFLDTHEKDGILSPEHTETYNKMMGQMDDLSNSIARLEQQAAMDAQMSAPTTQPLHTAPQQAGNTGTGRASAEYREAFYSAMRGAPASNVLSTGVDADGGYLVPDEFDSELVKAAQDNNVIRRLARVVTTTGTSKIPIMGTAPTAYLTDEDQETTPSGATFSQVELDAFKLTCDVPVSIELLQDNAFDLENELYSSIGQAFGEKEEQLFSTGTGDKQPTGIFTDKGGEVGVNATATDKITKEDLVDLVYSLKAAYRRNAAFLMQDDTVRAIRKLKDDNGNFVWQASLQKGQPDKLLGYPLYTTPFAPKVEAGALPIAFGDFSKYRIGDRGARSIQRLNEIGARRGQVVFLGTQRMDGQVVLREGIKLLQMAA